MTRSSGNPLLGGGIVLHKKKKSRKRGSYFKASLFCDIQKVDTVRMKKQENLFLKSTDS